MGMAFGLFHKFKLTNSIASMPHAALLGGTVQKCESWASQELVTWVEVVSPHVQHLEHHAHALLAALQRLRGMT